MPSELAERLVAIVRDAGGRVVGRTKLQKLVYLLVAADLENDVPFLYKHYGPYSDMRRKRCERSPFARYDTRNRRDSFLGGAYSIYQVNGVSDLNAQDPRYQLHCR